MANVLVTGVTGQDGGYLAERLVSEGHAVHGLVHASDGLGTGELRARVPAVTLHRGDLTDEAGLRSLIAEVRPDEVYNLAGISSVALSWEMPVVTADVTGLGAVRLFQVVQEWAAVAGTSPRVLQPSSAEIFGEPTESPQTENTPLRPVSPYGAAKAYAHQMAGLYRARGLFVSTVILYNHESPRRPTTFVTRKITQTVARISKGLAGELTLGNLEARRDWGWAPDYVDAMIRAVRHDEPDDYVVATGQARSVRDFVAAAFTRAGVHDWERLVRVDPAFFRPADATALVGDATKARSVLGWAPTVSFEELVGAMVDHDLADLDPANRSKA